MTTVTTHHPIAIIGGGLGGLTTARVLHTCGITSAIFELEPNRQARVQGGMLDIHENNGQQAVHAADLWEPAQTINGPARYEVTFDNGTTITTDLLIGADGAWSKVPPLLTDAWPTYTGISFVEVDFDADTNHPAKPQPWARDAVRATAKPTAASTSTSDSESTSTG